MYFWDFYNLKACTSMNGCVCGADAWLLLWLPDGQSCHCLEQHCPVRRRHIPDDVPFKLWRKCSILVIVLLCLMISSSCRGKWTWSRYLHSYCVPQKVSMRMITNSWQTLNYKCVIAQAQLSKCLLFVSQTPGHVWKPRRQEDIKLIV